MLVVSLGGSVINDLESRENYITKFREFMDSFDDKIVVVVGGGALARKYINFARKLGFDEYVLDIIGIRATRMNATLFITQKTYPRVSTSVEETAIALQTYKNVVMGGTEPGHTTDAVSLLVAERLHVKKVINITSVGGIYTEDPKKSKNAKIIPRMSYTQAKKLLLESDMHAGLNIPVDLIALKVAERSKIKIYVVPDDIDNLMRVIAGEDFKGTVIGEPNA